MKFFINLRVGMRVRVQCMTGYTKGVVIDFSRDCVHAITGNSSLVSVVKLTGEHGLMVESDKQPRPLPSSKYILIRRDQRLANKLIAAKNEELAASQEQLRFPQQVGDIELNGWLYQHTYSDIENTDGYGKDPYCRWLDELPPTPGNERLLITRGKGGHGK